MNKKTALVVLLGLVGASETFAQLTPSYEVRMGRPPYSEGYSQINDNEKTGFTKINCSQGGDNMLNTLLGSTKGWSASTQQQIDSTLNTSDTHADEGYVSKIEKACRVLANRLAQQLNQYQFRACTPNAKTLSEELTVSFWIKTPIDPTIQVDSSTLDPSTFNEKFLSLESAITVAVKVLTQFQQPLPKSYWQSNYSGLQDAFTNAQKDLAAFFKSRPELKADAFPPHPEAQAVASKVLAHYQFYYDALLDLVQIGAGDTSSLAVRYKNLLEVLRKTMTVLKTKYGFDENQGTRFGSIYGTVAEDLIKRLLTLVVDTNDQTLLLELRKRVGFVKSVSAGSNDSDTKSLVEDMVKYWNSTPVLGLYRRCVESRSKDLSSNITLLETALRKMSEYPHKVKFN